MTAAVVVLVALAVIAIAVVVVARLRRRPETGVVSFQRHIDALSPEARREVADRVKRQRDEVDGADSDGEAGN